MQTFRGHRVLYRQRDFPVLQNRLYATRHEALNCPTGDIVLVQDARTGLVHNAAFDPDLVRYDAEYQNDQSLSPAFRAHMEQVLKIVRRHFGAGPVVEVGCGKGVFLEMMLAAGMDAMGVDPAYEGDSDRVVRAHFTPRTEIRRGNIVLRHVLEHVRDPLAFLHAVREAAGGGGLIYVEVPCLDWIIRNRAWYDIYYEHVNYFRMSDFRRMFGRVIDSGWLFGGQYLYVVADLATLAASLGGAQEVSLPEDFTASIDAETSPGLRFVWGAASKGVIFTLLKMRAGARIQYCVDINPRKQGRFLPLVGVEVISPERVVELARADSTIYVTNPNYLDEIVEMSGNVCRYEVIR